MPELAKGYQQIDRSANHLVVRNYRAPDDTAALAAELPDSLSQAAAEQADQAPVYHIIRKGDTLGALARKHHTSVAALCRLNHIKESTLLQIGHQLRVK
ncbi:MAG: LysM peptidoglycan-binding domain-containing protein [Bacteroidales bacterium]|nr:LysM peptidoglycan-binding domain-containing protein [Bacteroidales bacterium]